MIPAVINFVVGIFLERELGHSEPDQPASVYLKVIAADLTGTA